MTLRHAAVALLLLLPTVPRAGEVRGVVAWGGPVPAAATIRIDRDQATCGDRVEDESLVVTGGGVEAVVVRIEVPGAKASPSAAVLDQHRCRYRPRVQVVAPGSTLELRNGDPVLHNVHGWLGPATAFNVPMPVQGGRTPRTLKRPGVIRVGCDVHAWMAASVVVTETPFAVVTAEGGRFTLPGVPAGTWQAVAWHERLGERRAMVTVPADGSVELRFAWP